MSQAQPTEDDDLPGHETEDPRDGTHASGGIAEINLTDAELVELGTTNAQINDDYSSSSDVTVLAIGGEEIIGSHSTSNGEDSVGPLLICEESGGQICLSLLYADTSANEDADSSEANADTALVFACVGGDNPAPNGPEDCGGAPITAGVSESHSAVTADKSDGSQTADQETTLADVCLGPEGQVAGVCSGIGIEAVSSESHSSIEDDNGNGTTTDDTGQTSRSSSVLGVQIAGEPVVDITDPTAISIPPDCPVDGSLVCLFLNQGESFVEVGGAASRQEAVHIALLVAGQIPGGALLSGHLGTAETRVVGMDRECPAGTVFNPDTGDCDVVEEFCPDGVTPIPPGGPQDCPGGEPEIQCPDGTVLTGPNKTRADCPGGGGDITDRGAGLALTGGSLLPLLAVSMILAAGGTGALATERRRRRP